MVFVLIGITVQPKTILFSFHIVFFLAVGREGLLFYVTKSYPTQKTVVSCWLVKKQVVGGGGGGVGVWWGTGVQTSHTP